MSDSPTLPNAGYADSSDEVLRLTWAVIDGVASDDDRRRLGELVNSQYQARKNYVKAVQLDRDLAEVLNSMHPPRLAKSGADPVPRISPTTHTSFPMVAGNLTAAG